MTRLSALNTAPTLGFWIGWTADRAGRKTADGYPPYNVERLATDDGSAEVIRITLAVAGFRAQDLDVTIKDGRLVISGAQASEPERSYIYRGIAMRRFQKAFVLAEGVEVSGAHLEDGLLSVDLVRPQRQESVRTIAIGGAG